MIIDYDIWAESPSTGMKESPKVPRSAINEAEALEQATQWVETLKTTTEISDWVPKYKAVEE